jgi:hypothetical protein
MISYLTLTFASEGKKPSEIVDRLYNIGFRPTTGRYDFKYVWDGNANIKDVLWFADKIHATLQGTGALFKLETIRASSEEEDEEE